MIGSGFNPSVVEDRIYEMMDDYIVGSDTYEEGLVDAITNYFTNCYPAKEWQLACSPWPDMSGGVCAISWIEDGHCHMVMFDYRKESVC